MLSSFGIVKRPTTQKEQVITLSPEQEVIYSEKGKQAAAATFAILSQRLQKAIQKGGVSNAIQYCNTAAYSITDSLSQVQKALIRRTSLKVRNPKNNPTALEKEVLKSFAVKAAAGEVLTPMVKILNNHNIAFYAPIITNDFCLKCHGKVGEVLTKSDYQAIQKYYPNDKAIGYLAGDLRGIWSIQFEK